MITYNIFQLPVEVRPMEKISGDPNWFRNWGFCHFLKVVSYFPDIAQDCSLGECLTSSRAETLKKNV